MKGKKCVGVFSYLNEITALLKSGLKCSVSSPEEFLSLDKIDEALKVNVCNIVFSLSQLMNKSTESNA
jgi:hypothetical protein